MVGAHEGGRVAFVSPADGIPTMTAGVEQDLGITVLVSYDDDAVFSDVGRKEVSRIGNLGIVSHEVPGAGKDVLELEPVDLLVREDAAVDETAGGIDHGDEISGA
jgi:hypothetical protein